MAEAEAIEVVPTLLIYHSGQALGSIVAPESRAQLVAFIEETLQHQTQEATTVQHIYDMIVVGGGPGGYTAALYAARAGMNTVVLEKLSAGGQMALTEQIDNYPGFEDGIDGFSLGEKMKRGTERFGVETKLTEVLSLELSGSIKKAVTSEGPMYAKTIVLATGAGPRELMQSKVILSATALLITIPAVLFYLTDFADLPVGERALASLFQAVTPRTAGYNTVDLTKMSDTSQAVTIMLMLTGGAPGSTAGGMKVTTLAVLIANAAAAFHRREDSRLFDRRLDYSAIRNAAAILLLYLSLTFVGAAVISEVEGLPLGACLYETASAAGTVGLTLGLTPQLGTLSQSILILLMFFGRVGGLTLIYAAFSGHDMTYARYPKEMITVG